MSLKIDIEESDIKTQAYQDITYNKKSAFSDFIVIVLYWYMSRNLSYN